MSTVIAPDKALLIAMLWAKLDTLPQRDLIERSDANQWINYMANLMPGDAMWHMVRAGGVGGSEIGGLVRNYLGHKADHEFSAHDWALSKLLRKTPEPAQGVLQRGHDMEPLHANRFYKEHNTERDQPAFDKLAKAQGSKIWMRYSPDDMVFLKKPTIIQSVDGPLSLSGRILVDYKAPTTVDEESRIAFQYTCQLHQGATLCQEQGIEISGAMLSQFNWATWTLKNDFVEIDEELCELIKESGDHYWDYVMRGEIPDYIVRKRLILDPKTRDEWQDAAIRLGQFNAMKTRIENESKNIREKLVNGLGMDQLRLDGQTISFPDAVRLSAITAIDEEKVRAALGEEAITGLQVKETITKYDTDALVKHLKELNVDVKPFRKLKRLDPTMTFNALVDAGYDPEEFMEESLRVTVEKSMKEQASDWFEQSFEPLELPVVEKNELDPADDSAAVIVNDSRRSRSERPAA